MDLKKAIQLAAQQAANYNSDDQPIFEEGFVFGALSDQARDYWYDQFVNKWRTSLSENNIHDNLEIGDGKQIPPSIHFVSPHPYGVPIDIILSDNWDPRFVKPPYSNIQPDLSIKEPKHIGIIGHGSSCLGLRATRELDRDNLANMIRKARSEGVNMVIVGIDDPILNDANGHPIIVSEALRNGIKEAIGFGDGTHVPGINKMSNDIESIIPIRDIYVNKIDADYVLPKEPKPWDRKVMPKKQFKNKKRK